MPTETHSDLSNDNQAPTGMIEIDGSQGEGGGQVLRSALALSLATGRPFVMHSIREERPCPGLLAPHLTSVKAAARVGAAHVIGGELGAKRLQFEPAGVFHGTYQFDVGKTGSATLVLQTLVPPLLSVPGRSRIVVEGGTHDAWAPPFEYLAHCLFPALERFGGQVRARLVRHGFFPAGGGRIEVEVQGAELHPADFLQRGALVHKSARALISRLPAKIARRQVKFVQAELEIPPAQAEVVEVKTPGPGSAILLDWQYEHAREIAVGFAKKRVSAERVAEIAVQSILAYQKRDAPVGVYLADQLLVPLALAGGGAFRTGPLSLHTQTNLDVLKTFFPALRVEVSDEEADAVTVALRMPKAELKPSST